MVDTWTTRRYASSNRHKVKHDAEYIRFRDVGTKHQVAMGGVFPMSLLCRIRRVGVHWFSDVLLLRTGLVTYRQACNAAQNTHVA
jgi:hypothetical protein